MTSSGSNPGHKQISLSLSPDDLARFEKIAARLGVGKSRAMSLMLRMLVVPAGQADADACRGGRG